MGRKFDRETATFGVGREYVVILAAPCFGHQLWSWVRAFVGRENRSKHHMQKLRDVTRRKPVVSTVTWYRVLSIPVASIGAILGDCRVAESEAMRCKHGACDG